MTKSKNIITGEQIKKIIYETVMNFYRNPALLRRAAAEQYRSPVGRSDEEIVISDQVKSKSGKDEPAAKKTATTDLGGAANLVIN